MSCEQEFRTIIREAITHLSDGTEAEYGSQPQIDDLDRLIRELQNIKASLRTRSTSGKANRKEADRLQSAIGALRFLRGTARRNGIKNGLLSEAAGEQMGNTLGVYGGGFKPFTTGHFAKLADAIQDNTHVILFYGMQQLEPIKMGKRGPLKSQQRFRGIGETGRVYDETTAQAIFDEYKKGLDRIPNVEVRLVKSQGKDEAGNLLPVRSAVHGIFKTLEDFMSGDLVDSDGNQYDKVTVYGDRSAMTPFLKTPKFKDLVSVGKIQFGGAVPESPEDYVDPDRLNRLMTRGDEEARDALRGYYSSLEGDSTEEVSDEEIERLQTVRGTKVRDLASTEKTSDEARRYLPPFLNSEEKDKIINILLAGEASEGQAEAGLEEKYFRALLKGIIRG